MRGLSRAQAAAQLHLQLTPSRASPSPPRESARGQREGNRAPTSAETKGEGRDGRGGRGGALLEDEGAGGVQPSREAAGVWRLPKIPESCSTVTYWAERSRLNQEKSKGKQAQRNEQAAPTSKGGFIVLGEKAVSAAASLVLGTGSDPCLLCILLAWDEQPGLHPTDKKAALPLLGTHSAPELCHYIQSRQEVHPSKETGQLEPLLPTQLQPDKCPDPRELWAPSTKAHRRPRVCSFLTAWDAAGNPREQT